MRNLTIQQYSHDRIGERWTLKDHARVLEHVHDTAKAARQNTNAAPETAQGAIAGHPEASDIREIYERLS